VAKVNVNVTAWPAEERRASSLIVLGVAIVVALAALALWWFVAATPAWLYWALVGLLVLVLVFTAILVFVQRTPKMAAASAAAASAESAPAETPAPSMESSYQPRVLTLRCGDCGTIFDVTDTGERPLYHTCPGCGAEGALRDPVAPEAAPAEEAPPEAYAPAPEPAYAPEPVAAAPVAPPVKKLKLRCGGCKEVFTIEDSGERPLRRACPHCGRMGQIS